MVVYQEYGWPWNAAGMPVCWRGIIQITRFMKKSLLLFIFGCLFSLSAWAQMPSWKDMQQQLASKLDLSSTQQTQWTALVEQYAPQIEALAGGSGQNAAKIKALMSKYDQARNALLTAKQLSKLASLQKQMGGGKAASKAVSTMMGD